MNCVAHDPDGNRPADHRASGMHGAHRGVVATALRPRRPLIAAASKLMQPRPFRELQRRPVAGTLFPVPSDPGAQGGVTHPVFPGDLSDRLLAFYDQRRRPFAKLREHLRYFLTTMIDPFRRRTYWFRSPESEKRATKTPLERSRSSYLTVAARLVHLPLASRYSHFHLPVLVTHCEVERHSLLNWLT